MEALQRLESAATAFILDPANHDLLTLVKGVRNGIVYGCKVRFPHALVMIFLFRSGTIRHKLLQVLKATRQHARNLGLFSLIYKGTMLLLRHAAPPSAPGGKPGAPRHRSADPFVAGLLAGYLVFGRSRSSVAQQIVTYVFARAAIGLAKLAFASAGGGGASSAASAPGVKLGGGSAGGGGRDAVRELVAKNAWPVFASVSWAAVMWLFAWHPEMVQPSMRSSMTYIYADSDYWDSLRTLLWHNK